MSYAWLRQKVAELASRVPKGYTTFDRDGQPAVQSELPAAEWVNWAFELLNSAGRDAEKQSLCAQLSRSAGKDNGGGRLYEVVEAFARGPVRRDSSRTPAS